MYTALISGISVGGSTTHYQGKHRFESCMSVVQELSGLNQTSHQKAK